MRAVDEDQVIPAGMWGDLERLAVAEELYDSRRLGCPLIHETIERRLLQGVPDIARIVAGADAVIGMLPWPQRQRLPSVTWRCGSGNAEEAC